MVCLFDQGEGEEEENGSKMFAESMKKKLLSLELKAKTRG